MRKELEEKLRKEFPHLLQDMRKGMNESCMYWGLAFGDGWHDIFRELCTKIMNLNPPTNVRFAQVKEKFGEMTIYMEYMPDDLTQKIYAILNEAEAKSCKTCEKCGDTETAKKRTDGWIMTLCDKCHKSHGEDRAKKWRSASPEPSTE